MPVYEYQCKACHKEFDYQQRMSDPDKTLCEACGKEALERLISRTAFSLKGGGWYKDLYASTKPESKSSDAPASSGEPRRVGVEVRCGDPTAAAPAAAKSTPAFVGRFRRRPGGVGVVARRRAARRAAAAVAARPARPRRRARSERARHRRPSGRGEVGAEVAVAALALRAPPRSRRPSRSSSSVTTGIGGLRAEQDQGGTRGELDIRDHKLPATTSQFDCGARRALNADPVVDGILASFRSEAPRQRRRDPRADPAKDVRACIEHTATSPGTSDVLPCTPKGCMRLLAEAGTELAVRVRSSSAAACWSASRSPCCWRRERDRHDVSLEDTALADEVRRADVVVARSPARDGALRLDQVRTARSSSTSGSTARHRQARRRRRVRSTPRAVARAITPVPGGVVRDDRVPPREHRRGCTASPRVRRSASRTSQHSAACAVHCTVTCRG